MPPVEGSDVRTLRGLRYLGGHPAAPPNELEGIDVSFDARRVRFERRGEDLGAIPWADVEDLSADAMVTRSRVTGPRVWFFGIVAMLLNKREERAPLRIADRRGAWLFEVDGISLDDLRVGLNEIRTRYAA